MTAPFSSATSFSSSSVAGAGAGAGSGVVGCALDLNGGKTIFQNGQKHCNFVVYFVFQNSLFSRYFIVYFVLLDPTRSLVLRRCFAARDCPRADLETHNKIAIKELIICC